jgi:RNA polymerase sigma factor (sigma-70 family)
MSPLAFSLRLLQAQPDERLLSLAGAGHEPAFEALVRRYRRPLLAYCRRLTGPDVSAEDVLQQALLQAWRALDAGIQVRDARAWLYRIVHNVAISSARGSAETPAELGNAVRGIGVEQLVEQRLAARDALAGLAALPALQREVMVETALEGRSHEEIATALGLSNGSVRGLIYRARATLRAAAAALIPGPLLNWAARQDHAVGAASAALAGGGSAGVAGAVLKGGAIVTVAGAIAGTTVVAVHPSHRHPTVMRATAHRLSGRNPTIAATSAAFSASGEAARPAADAAVASSSSATNASRRGASIVFADHHGGGAAGTQSGDTTSSSRSDSRHHEPGDSSGGGDAGRRHQGGTDSSGGSHHDGSGTGQTAASAASDDKPDGSDGGGAGSGTSSSGGTQTTATTQTTTPTATTQTTPTTPPISSAGTSTTPSGGD